MTDFQTDNNEEICPECGLEMEDGVCPECNTGDEIEEDFSFKNEEESEDWVQ